MRFLTNFKPNFGQNSSEKTQCGDLILRSSVKQVACTKERCRHYTPPPTPTRQTGRLPSIPLRYFQLQLLIGHFALAWTWLGWPHFGSGRTYTALDRSDFHFKPFFTIQSSVLSLSLACTQQTILVEHVTIFIFLTWGRVGLCQHIIAFYYRMIIFRRENGATRAYTRGWSNKQSERKSALLTKKTVFRDREKT